MTLTIVALGLVPLCVVGFMNAASARGAVFAQASDQLESVRVLKRNDLEGFFATLTLQGENLAANPFVSEAVMGLESAYAKLEETANPTWEVARKTYIETKVTPDYIAATGRSPSLQAGSLTPAGAHARRLYAWDNPHAYGQHRDMDRAADRSLYTRLHRRYHPYFRSVVDRFEFQDLLVVTPQSGQVVYSVEKNLDFGTSLTDGAFQNSNAAQVWREVVTTGAPAIVDFDLYGPALETPQAFVGIPVLNGERLISVLVFGLPVNRLNAIMSETSGMGRTGVSFLAGHDSRLRSQIAGAEENTILRREVNSRAVKMGLDGKHGVEMVMREDGERVLSGYSPLTIGNLNWALLVEIDESEVNETVAPLMRNSLIAGLIALAILLICSFALALRIVRPINRAAEVAARIAAGRLDSRIVAHDKNELGHMMGALSLMQAQLKQRSESDRETLEGMQRITQALDSASSGMIVGNAEGKIIAVNAAAKTLMRRELDWIRARAPDFDVEALNDHTLDACFFGAPIESGQLAVGEHTIIVTVTEIEDEAGAPIGTVLEWADWTSQAQIEADVSALIERARRGDLTERLDLAGKSGFFLTLSTGINALVDISQRVVEDMGGVLSALSRGDLSRTITTPYEGVFEKLKDDANATIAELTSIVQKIQSSADSVSGAAGRLNQANRDIDQMMSTQSSSLEQTANSMTRLNDAVRKNAQDARLADEKSHAVTRDATSGSQVVSAAVAAMVDIHDASARIADIIGVIDEIAFQTNLLALNASVEAAHAGDQGRGFAVVAREVRDLAERSGQAAQSIKNLIKDSVAKVGDGSKLVNETGQIFEQITDGVSEVSRIATGISEASGDQAADVGRVSGTVQAMDEATKENSGIVEDASNAALKMNQQAEELGQILAFFSLPNAGQTTREMHRRAG